MFFSISVFAEGQVTFQNYYSFFGDTGYFNPLDIQQTTDGGYIITGQAGTTSITSSLALLKTDSLGNSQWAKLYSIYWTYGGQALKQTIEGGYIILGSFYSIFGADDLILIKTDALGDTLWTKVIGGLGRDMPTEILLDSDGGYLVAGTTASIGTGHWDMFLLKTDSIGTQLWSRSFGTWDSLQGIANDEELISVKKTPANGFILGCRVHYLNKVYLVELDSIGNILWSKFYGTNVTQFTSLNVLSDGYIFTFGSYLVKIDTQGNILWFNAFYPRPLDAVRTNDGNYIWSKYNGIAKSDSLGNIIWSKDFNTIGTSFFSSVLLNQANDSSYIFCMNLPDSNQNPQLVMIKCDGNGNTTCSQSDITYPDSSIQPSIETPGTLVSNALMFEAKSQLAINTITIANIDCITLALPLDEKQQIEVFLYPNPFHSTATISTSALPIAIGITSHHAQLKIYNTMGALIRIETVTNITSYILNRNGLSEGLYFYELQNHDGGMIGTGKFVVD